MQDYQAKISRDWKSLGEGSPKKSVRKRAGAFQIVPGAAPTRKSPLNVYKYRLDEPANLLANDNDGLPHVEVMQFVETIAEPLTSVWENHGHVVTCEIGDFQPYHTFGSKLSKWMTASKSIAALMHPLSDFEASSALAIEFNALSQQWDRETEMMSNVTDMIMHDAYQKIIGMGKPALPFILRELKKNSGHWFWALYAITRFDAASDAETHDDAVAAWLKWGKEHGYLQA